MCTLIITHSSRPMKMHNEHVLLYKMVLIIVVMIVQWEGEGSDCRCDDDDDDTVR